MSRLRPMGLHLIISQGPVDDPQPILATSDPAVIRAAMDALERRCFPNTARPTRLRPVSSESEPGPRQRWRKVMAWLRFETKRLGRCK